MCTTPPLFTEPDTGGPVGTAGIITRDRQHGAFTYVGILGPVGDSVSAIVTGLFASPSALEVGIAAVGGVRAVTAGIGGDTVMVTGAGAMQVTAQGIDQVAAMRPSRIYTRTSAIRHGPQALLRRLKRVPWPARRKNGTTTSLRIKMGIFIGRPIRVGRNVQRTSGSPSRTVLPERNDRRLINLNGSLPVAGAGPVRNNLIAVTRRENGAISVLKATTVPEGVPVRALWGVPVEGVGVVVAVNFKSITIPKCGSLMLTLKGSNRMYFLSLTELAEYTEDFLVVLFFSS